MDTIDHGAFSTRLKQSLLYARARTVQLQKMHTFFLVVSITNRNTSVFFTPFIFHAEFAQVR